MRKTTGKGVVGLAAVASLALVAVIAWLAPVASAGDTQVQVFDPEGPFERFVDVGKPDLSPGDEIIEIHTLLDPASGAEAGRSLTHLKVLKVLKDGEDLYLAIDCTIELPEGTIVFYGGARLGQAFETGVTLPVTGGTGAYELVRGTVTLTGAEMAGAPGAILSFDLTTD